MRTFGRVVCCGSISQYDVPPEQRYGIKNLFSITTRQLRVEGFIVSKYLSQFPQGGAAMAKLLAEGKLKHRETIVEGFDKIPGAFIGLFSGDNIGKMVVKV